MHIYRHNHTWARAHIHTCAHVHCLLGYSVGETKASSAEGEISHVTQITTVQSGKLSGWRTEEVLGECRREIPSAWGWLSRIKINSHLLCTFPVSGIFHTLFNLHGKHEGRIRIPILQRKKKAPRGKVTDKGLIASKWQKWGGGFRPQSRC